MATFLSPDHMTLSEALQLQGPEAAVKIVLQAGAADPFGQRAHLRADLRIGHVPADAGKAPAGQTGDRGVAQIRQSRNRTGALKRGKRKSTM